MSEAGETGHRSRSSVSGQYVTDEEAATHPRTTIREEYEKPRASIGRVVHYVSYGTPGGEFPSVCRAATVTEVDAETPGVVGLCVMNPTGLFFHPLSDGGCAYALTPRGGTWHWPERT
jgi:hypothetical protein